MSSFRRELLGSIVSVSGEGDKMSGRMRIEDGFIGFKGHFPGMPVLPGVCKIMALTALWQKHTGRADRAVAHRLSHAVVGGNAVTAYG